jgi:hypothetical protein
MGRKDRSGSFYLNRNVHYFLILVILKRIQTRRGIRSKPAVANPPVFWNVKSCILVRISRLHSDVFHPALNYPVDGGSTLIYYFGTSPRKYKASHSGGQYFMCAFIL